MNQQQAGFTLIELVMVIVILGILAVVAVPQFVDLSGSADKATEQAVAAAISSATINNYAKCKSVKTGNPSTTPSVINCDTITGITNLSKFVSGLDDTWEITTPTGAADIGSGQMGTCYLKHTTGTNTNVSFQIMGATNCK